MRTSVHSESKPNSMQQTLRARSGPADTAVPMLATIRQPEDRLLATVREEVKGGG